MRKATFIACLAFAAIAASPPSSLAGVCGRSIPESLPRDPLYPLGGSCALTCDDDPANDSVFLEGVAGVEGLYISLAVPDGDLFYIKTACSVNVGETSCQATGSNPNLVARGPAICSWNAGTVGLVLTATCSC